jgi:hypothetical protein
MLKTCQETCDVEEATLEEDSDGDLDVPRCSAASNEDLHLEIEHQLSTTIADVGHQIWRGALLVADYLIQVSEICRANSQLLHFLKV